MATSTPPAKLASAVASCRSILQELLADLGPRFFDVRFWDGSVWPGNAEEVAFTLVLKHAGAVRRMFWPPRPLSMAMAYFYDDFDVEGEMRAFPRLCEYLETLSTRLSWMKKVRLAWRLWNLPRIEPARQGRRMADLSGAVHSRERDRQAICYHYDLSNSFYEKVLGPLMLYTSGIFANPREDLESAHERKMDLVCRKLRLRPGDRLLDIGCGWGAFLIFAARHYGVQTVGVTLSRPQLDYAREKIRAAGLETRCRAELLDYRDLEEKESFDNIAILEVTEHFGASQFPVFMDKAWRLLRPGGAMLMQQITLTREQAMPPASAEIMQHFVFPDGELVPLSFILHHAEKAGLELRDVESFREHYPLTLERWLTNLETHKEQVIAETDEAAFRTYRLYYAAAKYSFETNYYNLYHVLLVKPDGKKSRLPLDRLDWYRER